MRAHLDEPAPPQPIDPLCFFVRGWFASGERHGEVAAIEAWAGETIIGETRVLLARPDVNTALNLPADVRTGFELFAHHPSALPGEPLAVAVRARFRDGTRSAPLASTTVAT